MPDGLRRIDMVDGRTPEQLRADGDDRWPDGTPYVPAPAANGQAGWTSGLWDVASADAYHAADAWLSHSALQVFRQSRPLYHGRYVTRTIPHPEPTPAMLLGTVVHALALEPDGFQARFAVAPKCDRRTAEGRGRWAEFERFAEGKTVVSVEVYDQAHRIRDGILTNGLAADLLAAAGRNECSIRWQDEATAVGCKARFDRLLESAGIIVDLKTAADPSPEAWARQAYSFGYFRQAAFYRQGHSAVLGGDAEFLFVVVGTSEPFECAVMQLDYDALHLGQQHNADSLRQLADCRERDEWSSPFAGKVNEVALPRWAWTRE